MVSIIVPVYNTNIKCLERCLNSLSNQNNRDFEVIIVDDGSNSEYSRKLDSYSDGQHFFVLHQKNTGVSAARNNGFEHAKGEYITFVDSDDYVSPDFISNACELIIKHNADMVMGGIEIVNGNSSTKCTIKGKKELVYHDSSSLRRYFLTAQYEKDSEELSGLRCGGPWCKLYKRSVLENVRFRKDIPVYEDMIFNLETLENIKTIVISPETWYSYVIFSSSAMRKFRPDGINEQILVMDFLNRYKIKHPEVSSAIAKKTGECIKKVITSTLYHKDSDISEKSEKLKELFSQEQTQNLLDGLNPAVYPGLSRSEKLFYTLCAKRMTSALHIMFSIKKLLKRD